MSVIETCTRGIKIFMGTIIYGGKFPRR